VVDVFDRQITLVFMPLGVTAVLAAAVGQHSRERNAVLLIEWQHPVVEQIGGGERRLDVIELCKADRGVGVDEGLLVNAADPFERADMERVLGAAVPGTDALEFSMRFLVRLRLLQCRKLALGQDQAVLKPPLPPGPSAVSPWW
jgi:hypothetical protein